MAAGNQKKTSDKGKGKAPAKKRQYDDGSDNDHFEDRTDENASEPEPPKKRRSGSATGAATDNRATLSRAGRRSGRVDIC
ncbi:hypothetical protein BDV93DRAFT_565791 [Ceratobasidium sp. AG-I]|nr:hypothetical protein BDV93DRAFT_565791 [Ceratobasidium sp. AG-I]